MKKFWFLPLILWGIMLTCCSSSNEEETPNPDNLSLAPRELNIGGEGGTLTLTVTAADEWGLISSASWVKCTPSSGMGGSVEVTLTIEQNNSQTENRTATLTLKSGLLRDEATLVQTPYLAEVPVEDAALKARLTAQCDSNGDGIVSQTEAAATSELDLSGLGLENLDILTWFPNLRKLDCSDNNLTAIDSDLLKQLEELDCSNNQIGELDLRETSLRTLNATGNPLSKVYVPSNYTLPEGYQLPAGCELVEPEIFTPEGYTLTWSDEFDGTALNTANWTPEIGRGDNGWGNNELEYYTSRTENLAVRDGHLVITAIKESYQGAPVTSARLITKGKVFFTYGYVVASIKLPKTANGLWPAFWMMGNDFDQVGWPKCGETDILEMGHSGGISAGTQERYLNGAMHWGPMWNQHQYYSYGHTHPYSVQDGEFHTFTCIWNEESVSMYIDLEKYPDTKPYFVMDIQGDPVNQYFHKDNFLLLNLAVGGNFPGIHDIGNITALSGGKAEMVVDYVRVFQKK